MRKGGALSDADWTLCPALCDTMSKAPAVCHQHPMPGHVPMRPFTVSAALTGVFRAMQATSWMPCLAATA